VGHRSLYGDARDECWQWMGQTRWGCPDDFFEFVGLRSFYIVDFGVVCRKSRSRMIHAPCTAKFLPSAVDLTVHHRGASLICGPSICFTIIPSTGHVSYYHCLAYLTLPCLALPYPAYLPRTQTQRSSKKRKNFESIDIQLVRSPVSLPHSGHLRNRNQKMRFSRVIRSKSE